MIYEEVCLDLLFFFVKNIEEFTKKKERLKKNDVILSTNISFWFSLEGHCFHLIRETIPKKKKVLNLNETK